MQLRTVTRAAGVVGGVCWLVRYVLDAAGSGDGAASGALYWAGLALLFVALAGFGSELVSKSALWLQGIVGVAFPLLVWSVLEVLDPGTDPSLVDTVFGGAVLLLCVSRLVKGRESDGGATRRQHGAHAR